MSDIEDWFEEAPNRKWYVGAGVFFIVIVLVLVLRPGPDDAVEKYLTAISDMEYREAASFHMNDDGSWMGNLDYWDDYFGDGCGHYF